MSKSRSIISRLLVGVATCALTMNTTVFAAPIANIANPPDPPTADNYCNEFLDAEAQRAYDEAGVKRLLAVTRKCPLGVSLQETLDYVNKTLFEAFGDHYTFIMSPKEWQEAYSEIAGSKPAFEGGGLGLKMSIDSDNKLPGDILGFSGVIEHVMSDSPAFKAGVIDGDKITAIAVEGQKEPVSVIGKPHDDVIKMLRGPVGKPVTITFEHAGTITLTREEILNSDTVWTRDLGNGIYAIVVDEFQNDTFGDIANAIGSLNDKAKGYVLDVRRNPGGLFEGSILSAALMIPNGVIVSNRERIPGEPRHPNYKTTTYTRIGTRVAVKTVDESSGKILDSHNMTVGIPVRNKRTGEETIVSSEEIPFLGGKPIAMLADAGTASAAEVISGAVQQNTRLGSDGQNHQVARLFGVRTYGKFIGQDLKPCKLETGCKATTFRYFSPNGHTNQWLGGDQEGLDHSGLTPDETVEQPPHSVPYTATDAQLAAGYNWVLHQTN